MYDAANWQALDPGQMAAAGALVAGYVDGKYQWPAEAWAAFRAAGVTVVQIAVLLSSAAHVLDVEPGNADALDSVMWVQERRRDGMIPAVYCGGQPGYSWGDVVNAHIAARVDPPMIWWSNPNGISTLPAGAIARQHTFAGPYDVSIVADYWPGVDVQSPVTLVDARKYAADATARIQAAMANEAKALESLRGW